MLPHRLSIATALLVTAAVGPAAAQDRSKDLAPGRYTCSAGAQQFGSIEIDGARYRASGEGWSSYRRLGPAILWGGALGAISAAGEEVGTSISGSGFDIQIKPSNGGAFQLVRCRA